MASKRRDRRAESSRPGRNRVGGNQNTHLRSRSRFLALHCASIYGAGMTNRARPASGRRSPFFLLVDSKTGGLVRPFPQFFRARIEARQEVSRGRAATESDRFVESERALAYTASLFNGGRRRLPHARGSAFVGLGSAIKSTRKSQGSLGRRLDAETTAPSSGNN